MTLRTFHLLFIVLVVIGADLFGGWSVWRYARTGDAQILALGILGVAGGFGLIYYAWRLVRSFDAASID
jgi:hypothetical protein